MLGILKPLDQVGVYRVATRLALFASFGLQAVNMVVAPHFASLYAKREMDKLQRLVTRSAQIVLAFNLIITSLFILFGKIFLDLVFGKEITSAYVPLLILLIGQLVNSAAGSVGFLLNMTGHEKDTAQGGSFSCGYKYYLKSYFSSSTWS